MATPGSYRIWTADKDGNALVDWNQPLAGQVPQPQREEAVDIYFGLDAGSPQPPPKEQIELLDQIDEVLSAARRLYLDATPPRPGKFRRCYIRLFRLAQLGLEGADASQEVARGALQSVSADLVNDEAERVKNGHMSHLGELAFWFSLPFLFLYVVLTLPGAQIDAPLARLGVQRTTAAHFMLLWIGCFVGVWLSYGIRTAVFTLKDLTSTDGERLQPHLRLIFAGAMTMVVGLMFGLGIVEIKLGGYPLTDIARQPSLALLVGLLCGISNLTLPAAVSQKASALIGAIK